MKEPPIIDQGYGIATIDTGFQRPGLVASHLIVEGDRAALVDVGVAPAAPRILEALQLKGVRRENVDLVMVTHVHLDHAGGAGVLMRELPNARLVVHPRGARHMIDPSKLIAGATAVYGEAEMRASFGDILPVAEGSLIEAADGFRLDLNGRPLLFLDTPGHARHHYSVFDERSRGFFAGDTFGLSYREFDTVQGAFVFPTTSPVQFDPEALHASIERLLSYEPQRMFLTHFGCVGEPRRLADQLHEHIDRLVAITREAAAGGSRRGDFIRKRMTSWLLESLRSHGCLLSQERIHDVMAMDIELNAQGLEYWAEHSCAVTAGNRQGAQ